MTGKACKKGRAMVAVLQMKKKKDGLVFRKAEILIKIDKNFNKQNDSGLKFLIKR